MTESLTRRIIWQNIDADCKNLSDTYKSELISNLLDSLNKDDQIFLTFDKANQLASYLGIRLNKGNLDKKSFQRLIETHSQTFSSLDLLFLIKNLLTLLTKEKSDKELTSVEQSLYILSEKHPKKRNNMLVQQTFREKHFIYFWSGLLSGIMIAVAIGILVR